MICKGVSNGLECHICHKILFDSSSKSKHVKRCKEKSQELVVIGGEKQIEVKEKEIIAQLIVNNRNCNNNKFNKI